MKLTVLICICLSVLSSRCSSEKAADIEYLVSNIVEQGGLKLYMYPFKHSPLKKPPRMYWRLELELWNLIPSHLWTKNPEEADFFVFSHTLFGHWDRKNSQSFYINNELHSRLHEVFHKYPFFNRTKGRDHLTVYVGDNGPNRDCIFSEAPTLVKAMFKDMIKIGYYGREDKVIGNDWRSDIDIAMPMFNEFHKRAYSSPLQHLREGLHAPHQVFYFRGNYGNGEYWCEDTLLRSCSSGIRPWLHAFLRRENVREHVQEEQLEMTSWFAPCPSGAGCWSTRLYDAIHRLVLPILLSNHAVYPFNRVLNWSDFTYQVDADELVNNCQPKDAWRCDEAETIVMDFILKAEEMKRICHNMSHSLNSACEGLVMIQKIEKLAEVRDFFTYDPNKLKSAWGLFLVELATRKERNWR